MKVKAANGVARILKDEGVNWVSCYPTSHINNALGEEGVPIYMMGEERFGVAVADAFSRVTCGRRSARAPRWRASTPPAYRWRSARSHRPGRIPRRC